MREAGEATAPGADVAGVVLAAGESRRFPGTKQLLELGGRPLVRRAVETALEADLRPVVVVVGWRRGGVEEALAGLPCRVVANPLFSRGQATSVAAGVAALGDDVRGALFLPADQPLLEPAVLLRLTERFRRSSGPLMVVPVFAGQRRAPVLFHRDFFLRLAALEGDAGGRRLLELFPESVEEVEFPDETPFLDVDTPEDWRRLRALAEE